LNSFHALIPSKSSSTDGLYKSNFASIRLRIAPCFEALRKEGYRFTLGEIVENRADAIIVGKIGASDIDSRSHKWLAQLIEAKSRGASIYLDYTDHHLGFKTPMTLFYQRSLDLADCCIVPSEFMAKLLRAHFHGPIIIIEDSIEITSQPVKAKLVTSQPTALWFGHASNIEFLIDFINSSHFLMAGYNLIVLSNESGLNFFQSSHLNCLNPRQLKLALWSVDTMLEAARLSDFCIIPSNLSNPSKIGASSNRLITSFALGLPTAADYLPSYQEFSDYFVDIRSSFFNNLMTNPLDFSDKVISAQSSIVNRFSVEKISNDWLKLLSPKQ
jgi:hypothetical protein